MTAENARPGTAAWHLTGHQTPGGIEGYASAVEAQVGQSVRLYVSTAAASFHVEAYRMGYYQGLGARLVWRSGSRPGSRQPDCPVVPGINMVECHWQPSITVPVTATWVQGEYLLKLVGDGGQQSYVPLTVWDPASTATYVIMDGSFTDQVFNDYGGYDLYQGATPCAPRVYPCSSRSRVVSFDRPYAGAGDGGYLGLTYPLTRLAEEHGLDVTYWTDLTLHEHGDLLTHHVVLMSPGHDEEWSRAMRTAATDAAAHGVNIAFFGASPVLRKIRLQPSAVGPDREVVNYRDARADPDYGVDNAEVSQNDWANPPTSEPSSTLVGATYIGYNNHARFPLVVTDPTSWLFDHTGLARNATVPGMMSTDFQAYLPGEPGPTNVVIQARSPVEVEGHGAEHADTSYYTMASGAGVWQSGTNSWIGDIGTCVLGSPCPSGLAQTMTLNVFATLGAGPLGEHALTP
ncbi:MAG TPA: N,N-dimethylformamidase beta subunit family domain-containing protein [Mycobacteriales bacterium]